MEIYVAGIIGIFILFVWGMSLHIGKAFVIKISPGKVIVKKGSPPSSFIKECKLIIRHQIVRGYIYGCKDEKGIALKFSSSLKDNEAQRFRNVFPFEQYSSRSRPNGSGDDHPKVRAKTK